MSKFHQPIEAGGAFFASVLRLPAKALAAAGLLSVVLLAPAAQAAATITGVKAVQRYPWNGKVDISYTVSGLVKAANDEGMTPFITVLAIDRTTMPWTTNVADIACLFEGPYATNQLSDVAATLDGTHQIVWDLDAQKLTLTSTNVVFAVLGDGGVQLWENGPYWAKCNVGATKPEEYGYYFWWGDTVGYTANTSNATWTGDRWKGVTWEPSAGTRMNESPFYSNVDTFGMTLTQLQSAGYVDSSTNLVAAHDAATAHLGAPWRMPTDAEMDAITNNCTTTWVENWNKTGVKGRVVTGKGNYSSRTIFLPAAGYGDASYLRYLGSYGYYWSSTPYLDHVARAWCLNFGSSIFGRNYNNRYYGFSVRPLRGFAK